MNIPKRYEGNKTTVDGKRKTVYRSILYPKIDPSPNDIYIIPSEFDRLDLLAYKYYNDVRYWWIIAQANNLGKGSMYVPAGIRIRIPKNLSKISADFDKLNSNR